jgi:hypothetical protein
MKTYSVKTTANTDGEPMEWLIEASDHRDAVAWALGHDPDDFMGMVMFKPDGAREMWIAGESYTVKEVNN